MADEGNLILFNRIHLEMKAIDVEATFDWAYILTEGSVLKRIDIAHGNRMASENSDPSYSDFSSLFQQKLANKGIESSF